MSIPPAVALLLLFASAELPALAATYRVTSAQELASTLQTLKAGDRVVVANGRYELTEPLLIAAVGEKDAPVVIAAEAVGGTEITGSGGVRVTPAARHVRIEGFVFTHAAGKFVVEAGATHVDISRNVFELAGVGPYLLVAADQTEIAYNEFRNKRTKENMLSVIGPGADRMAQGVWVHHNYFHDFQPGSGNGHETIRFGLSGRSMSDARGLVEYNLFERCDGELELVSNKCCSMVYRYNTFRDSKGQLTLRHGNRCVVYGNTLVNTWGIRFFGDDHRIFSNYLEGNRDGIIIGNGGAEVADGAKLTSHDRPDRCEVSFNTLVNNTVQIALGYRENGLGAVEITIANNLIVQGRPTRIDGQLHRSTWRDNVAWDISPEVLLPKGIAVVDPKLVRGTDGRLRLTESSPLRDKGAASSSATKDVDFEGQVRDGKPDIGADEFSAEPVAARPLTPRDVGPAAVSGTL